MGCLLLSGDAVDVRSVFSQRIGRSVMEEWADALAVWGKGNT
ncbi:hypothetical protein [Synechococcus sp. PROS-7-1]|nr:hypothetical protein [Synechococcus sp. PROS-7-1]